jgi:hypothetical protein
VHQSRTELLEQLLLPEDVGQLAAEALRRHALLAAGRPGVADQRGAEADPPDEQRDGDRDDGREDGGG